MFICTPTCPCYINIIPSVFKNEPPLAHFSFRIRLLLNLEDPVLWLILLWFFSLLDPVDECLSSAYYPYLSDTQNPLAGLPPLLHPDLFEIEPYSSRSFCLSLRLFRVLLAKIFAGVFVGVLICRSFFIASPLGFTRFSSLFIRFFRVLAQLPSHLLFDNEAARDPSFQRNLFRDSLLIPSSHSCILSRFFWIVVPSFSAPFSPMFRKSSFIPLDRFSSTKIAFFFYPAVSLTDSLGYSFLHFSHESPWTRNQHLIRVVFLPSSGRILISEPPTWEIVLSSPWELLSSNCDNT